MFVSFFEQALEQHGDDLYRLAVLLSFDQAAANALLRRTARRFRDQAPRDLHAIAETLFAQSQAERGLFRRRDAPARITAGTVRTEDALLVAAIARLPRAQRFALGMEALHAFKNAELPVEQEWRIWVRDAIITLLPVLDSDHDPALFDPDRAPEECRAARMALLLDPTVAQTSSGVRGHLTLCETCRTTLREWRRLTVRVEETLRDALRPIRLPAHVAAQTVAAVHPDTRPPLRRLMEYQWTHRAILLLVVLTLTILIVWPREQDEPPPPVASSHSLRELVERAGETLYTPPPGDGVWQGSYLTRWTFVDQTYANLRGDLWIDRKNGQHRIQLVHQQGGGPYEFQLADRRGQVWYAITPAYGATIGLPLDRNNVSGIHFPADADRQSRLLQARLESGAWALPRRYLAQARVAGLQSWGRRQMDDGSQVEVIGFRGVSLLGFPPDAPDAGDTDATILLAIDGATGLLREIRELIGPVEGEQVSRTVWAFDGGREVDPREETRTFGIAFAWNGQGTFLSMDSIATPYVPLIPAEAIIPLDDAIGSSILLPDPPPDTVEAVLARDWETGGGYIALYHAPGRRLTVRSVPLSDVHGSGASDDPDEEQVVVKNYAVVLRPGLQWRYRAMVVLSPSQAHYGLQVEAQGYTRAELLSLLTSIDVVTPERYQEQVATFIAQVGNAMYRRG
ncbi:MAG: hypothetical protein ACUVSW_13570 [Roseiflexus sp.]